MKPSCKKIFLRCLLLLSLIGLTGCHQEADPYSSYRQYDAAALYAKAEQQLAHRDYEDAVESLEALEILYPFGPHAQQTQLYLIYAYYQKKDMAAVVASVDRYIRLYPRGHGVAYAHYMKAMANFKHGKSVMQTVFQQDKAHRDLTLIEESFKDFKYVKSRYPQSDYAVQAEMNMVFLLDMLARAEYYAADYYYRRGAYVAAANRATYIIDHYPQSTETAKALALLYQANQALHLPDKAEDALRILELNYPDSAELHAVLNPPKKSRFKLF